MLLQEMCHPEAAAWRSWEILLLAVVESRNRDVTVRPGCYTPFSEYRVTFLSF